MSKHVIDDAMRCLQCKNPMCSKGCPVNAPIREVIHLLLNHNIEAAGQLLFENNPLSLVCSYICPQENQCEGHCVLGRKGMPVQISAIERYISDFYLNLYKPERSAGTRGRIAIIGSGPAGITIAHTLANRGYAVTIFEGNDRIGGVMRYGIPEFRLPKRVLDRLGEKMLDMGIQIRPNTTIGQSLTIEELFRDGFRAIFMGTGTWKPLKLGIPGESLGHVHFAIEYLRNPDAYRLGKHVAIIGAGNVSMDVARTAIRHGAEQVVIFCNRDESCVTAREVEAAYAKIDGAVFAFYKTAVEFVDGGVMFADTEVYTDADGQQHARPIPGSETLHPCDSAIVAISQGPRAVIVSSTQGIDIDHKGLVSTDCDGRTSRPGIFASGDVVTGAKTVVAAVKASQRVADAIDAYVQGLPPR